MTGDHLGDVLSGLLDGELTPAQEAAARSHLDRCAYCTAELEAVEAVRLRVRSLPPVEAPFGFFERMLLPRRPAWPERSSRPAWPERSSRPAWPERSSPPAWPERRRAVGAALAAGAAAAMLFLSVSPPPQQPVSPSVASLIEAHATSASVSGDVLSTLTPAGVPVSFAP